MSSTIAANRIAPCLWFDTEAEDAATLYTSIFSNSRIGTISRYGEAGQEFHRKERGSVMTVAFELDGLPFLALNGGLDFNFSEAISFQVFCDSQAEVDHFWDQLSEGGITQQCGWLKDRFGVSWQVVPRMLPELLNQPDADKSQKVMQALLQMKKLDIAALQQAAQE